MIVQKNNRGDWEMGAGKKVVGGKQVHRCSFTNTILGDAQIVNCFSLCCFLLSKDDVKIVSFSFKKKTKIKKEY